MCINKKSKTVSETMGVSIENENHNKMHFLSQNRSLASKYVNKKLRIEK